ncbi:uncharacterized protein G2W53_013824 [Senna tora]|uniref:Uncharacterized protein n=1 Tax=Senna tora TaxID=362788 RepID=A0A834U2S4_9FABA|nr:uncharacterized protein G2W53_013824 [Senna tora]
MVVEVKFKDVTEWNESAPGDVESWREK